jgi:hypothetical protein
MAPQGGGADFDGVVQSSALQGQGGGLALFPLGRRHAVHGVGASNAAGVQLYTASQNHEAKAHGSNPNVVFTLAFSLVEPSKSPRLLWPIKDNRVCWTN